MMQEMYEIKLNGLEELIYKIKKDFPAPDQKNK
ncbi:MAG: hypothetical protein WA951_13555 [Leeuwenhoekiella sp.]